MKASWREYKTNFRRANRDKEVLPEAGADLLRERSLKIERSRDHSNLLIGPILIPTTSKKSRSLSDLEAPNIESLSSSTIHTMTSNMKKRTKSSQRTLLKLTNSSVRKLIDPDLWTSSGLRTHMEAEVSPGLLSQKITVETDLRVL